MAGISGAAPCQDPKSSAVSPKTTPCDRPRFLSSNLHDPNWIFRARHILPPTRSIVVGASRMLASVIGFESSSSSSSSSDRGISSDGTHDNNDYQDVSSQGVHEIEDREPKLFAGKNETMGLIQQLLTQESFSRKECDKLTDIIKSRVVDSPSLGGLRLGRLDEIPERADALEATRLLEEEKSGANSKSGSPMCMAKSCMQTRPSWGSYSKKNIEFRSPSSIAIPLSIGGNFLYSSKRKRGSPATGSWNIHDEIRKVRSKATEEAPRTPSSSKIDRSSFPLESKTGTDSILASNLEPATEKPVDASRDLAAKPDETLDVGQRLQSTVDTKTAANSGWSFSWNLASILRQGNAVAPDANHLKESNGCVLPFSSTREGIVQDSQVEDKNCWTLNEVAGISNTDGFPSGSNMSSKVDKEQNHRPKFSKEEEADGYGHYNGVRVAKVKCEVLCETSNETDAAASGLQQHRNTPTSKDSLAGKSNSGLETQQQQQQGKKPIRYNTRNRGRRR